MTKQCTGCGAELIEGSKFCTVCGKNVEQQPVEQQPVEEQPVEQPTEQQQEEQPIEQQPVEQQPVEEQPVEETPVAPVQPEPQQPIEKKQKTKTKPPKTKKKRSKKLLFGLLIVIVAAVIIVIIAFALQGGPGSFSPADNRFVGEWQQSSIGNPPTWMFNNDSTFEITPPDLTMPNGTWKVTGSQLSFYDNLVFYTYGFSTDGNFLTLTRIGQTGNYPTLIELTRGGLQGTTQTPDIKCIADSNTNRVIIESIDPNVKWSDIQITTPINASWQVQDSTNKGLAKIGVTSTITGYVSAGDSIFLMGTTGQVTVTLKFLPTNVDLGTWTVNL
jgi:hypothetical protein